MLLNYDLIDLAKEEFNDKEIDVIIEMATKPSNFDIITVNRIIKEFEFNSLLEDYDHWITRFQMLT